MGSISAEDHQDHYKARIDFRGDSVTCQHRHGFLPDAWLCGTAMMDSLRQFLVDWNEIEE